MAIDKATIEEKKVCHSCGAAIPARDTYCMHCGARQQTEESPRPANNWFSQAGSLDDSLNSGYTPPLQAAAGETPPTETVKSTFLKPVKDVSTRSPVPGRLAPKPAEPRKQDPEPEETDINGSAATTFIKPVRTSKESSSRRKYGSAPTVPIENFVDPIEGVKGPGFHGDNTTAAGVKKSSKGKMPAKPAKAFDWKRWIPVAAGVAVICLLVIVFSAGGSTNKTVERVSSEIASVENAFLDEDGYVALEHKDQLLSSVYQAADEMDEVDYCERNEYGVYMVLENGLGMHYQAPVSGLAAGGTELEVYAYQPFYDEFTAKDKAWYDIAGKMIGRCGEYPSEAIEALERLEITDNKANRFYNQDVTLEWLKKPHQNSVIVWVGHGGYSPKTHSTLLLTVEYSDTLYKKYKDDFDNHRIEIVHSKPKNTICITPAFFAHHLKADSLENSIVYLASCFSGKDDVLVSTLLSKGASAVYWNSGEILQHYNNRMCRSVMEALCDGASTGNALAIAQDANGALDNTLFGLIKKNVWVDCSGDQYLTLQEMYNRANRASAAETIPPTQPQQTWPTQRELFNGKCWMLAVGPTLGGQYVYKFYEDGTYSGYNVGSGQKLHGTYAYDHGVLELDGELYDLIEPDHFQSRNTYYNAQFDSEIHSDLYLGGDDMWNNMMS